MKSAIRRSPILVGTLATLALLCLAGAGGGRAGSVGTRHLLSGGAAAVAAGQSARNAAAGVIESWSGQKVEELDGSPRPADVSQAVLGTPEEASGRAEKADTSREKGAEAAETATLPEEGSAAASSSGEGEGPSEPTPSTAPHQAHSRTTSSHTPAEATPASSGSVQQHAHPRLDMHLGTTSDGLYVHEVCSREHANQVAERFTSLLAGNEGWTACGSGAWLDAFAAQSPGGKKVLFDIGCNKGYTSSHFFALWAPEIGFSPQTLVQRRPEVWCGNCGDCHEEVPARGPASGAEVSVYCLEPSQANFAGLIKTRDAFFANNSPKVQWLTLNVAASNASGMARFSRECTSEECSLDSLAESNVDLVRTTTFDQLVEDHSIDHVDVLKIDTEGYDPAVIVGAMKSLAAGKVSLLSFEYHKLGIWKAVTLRRVTAWLSGLDYVCYFDGQPTLTRITGCWDNRYEFFEWSNVACVPRTHPMYPVMERMSLRHEMFPDSYRADGQAV